VILSFSATVVRMIKFGGFEWNEHKLELDGGNKKPVQSFGVRKKLLRRLRLKWKESVNELIPRSRVLLEKLIVTQLVRKFPAFYGTRRFITVFIKAHKRKC